MEMRDRLIEMLKVPIHQRIGADPAEVVADYLLANGVILQPSADVVEVRHGEWIDKPTGRYMHMGSWCSVCGEKSGIGGIESNRHKPYCPNCGAKMDGKEQDNE